MLDSGRGAPRDVVQAAIWYARAAAGGNRRAAFNLGQLYESGEGVPANIDLSRAWYAAADLPAARERLAEARSSADLTGACYRRRSRFSPLSKISLAPGLQHEPKPLRHGLSDQTHISKTWRAAHKPAPAERRLSTDITTDFSRVLNIEEANAAASDGTAACGGDASCSSIGAYRVVARESGGAP